MESLFTVIASFSWELAVRNIMYNKTTKYKPVYIIFAVTSLLIIELATLYLPIEEFLLLAFLGVLVGYFASKRITLP